MAEKIKQQTTSTSAAHVSDPITPVSNNNAGMFSNLTDFSVKRSTKQAIGFYIAYLVLIILLGALVGGLVGLVSDGGEGFISPLTAGVYIGVITSLVISFTVIYRKKLLGNYLYIILAILSGLLALVGGGILGLIPSAYLTTR